MITDDYAKGLYMLRQHHMRYASYVEKHGLPCQDCRGYGRHIEFSVDGYNCYADCGWCEGTGKVTRWVRGVWLRTQPRKKIA